MQFPVFTVSDVRELCLLGLRDYTSYNFSCQRTLRALCLCSFVGLSHPFWRCFSNQTNSVFDFNCCCYGVPWLWFKPEHIPKIQNKDKLQGWWALRPALRCIHDAFNSDTFTLVVHMSVIMGFFGWRNDIALKVSGLIHNRRAFVLHPHPPPTAPAHTHTFSLSGSPDICLTAEAVQTGTEQEVWQVWLIFSLSLPLTLSWDPYQFLTCIWPRTDDAKPFIPLQQVGKEAGRTKAQGGISLWSASCTQKSQQTLESVPLS